MVMRYFGRFRRTKKLIEKARLSAHRAREAFKDASQDMHSCEDTIRDIHHHVPENAPREMALHLHKIMHRTEDHAMVMKHHARKLREYAERLDKQVKPHGHHQKAA